MKLFSLILFILFIGCSKTLICRFDGFYLDTNPERNTLSYRLISWSHITKYNPDKFKDTLTCPQLQKCAMYLRKETPTSFLDGAYDKSLFKISFEDTSIISIAKTDNDKYYGMITCNIKKDGKTRIIAKSDSMIFYADIVIMNSKIKNITSAEQAAKDKDWFTPDEKDYIDSLGITKEQWIESIKHDCHCLLKEDKPANQ